MKRATCFFLALLALMPVCAQQSQPSSDETVVVKKSDLTPEQVKKIQSQAITDQLKQYREWSDLGAGIGIAVRDSLTAVKDVAVDFSKTDVGKFTLFMVAWKIMAKDILSMGNQVMGYLVGIPFFIFSMLAVVWSYQRQCMKHRVLVKSSKEGKEWTIIDPDDALDKKTDGAEKQHVFFSRSEWAIAHVAVGVLVTLASCFIVFAKV